MLCRIPERKRVSLLHKIRLAHIDVTKAWGRYVLIVDGQGEGMFMERREATVRAAKIACYFWEHRKH